MRQDRPPRFALLTDAAIRLIAEAGMRGLTHRAVDARAGVPTGTTSVHFRTRRALVEAVVERLADLDQAELEDQGLRFAGSTGEAAGLPDALQPDHLDAFAAQVAVVLDAWLSTGRTRTLVRYACLLEATHHPELRTVLAHGVGFRVQARELLARAGAPDAERRGDALVAFVDGLVFDRLIGAGSLSGPVAGTPESVADLQSAVTLALRAATAPLAEPA
ncbi:TetR family transcriptional regulator [Cellulomonas fimi]|uniref:TetR/AcrR family transcriptional regulator n=1 Tax=Cellulomonas fimi TaxID=1708 RepID=UPI00234DB968|nr:TetR/AcrR family transcriptional regulator [Cellulomonas fimi]MDC7123414.1 TetR family transcriptional regulator [Cellulomonas fimi]